MSSSLSHALIEISSARRTESTTGGQSSHSIQIGDAAAPAAVKLSSGRLDRENDAAAAEHLASTSPSDVDADDDSGRCHRFCRPVLGVSDLLLFFIDSATL